MPSVHEASIIIKLLRLIGRPLYFVIVGLLEFSFQLIKFKPKSKNLIKIGLSIFFIIIISTTFLSGYIYIQYISPLPDPEIIFSQTPPATSQIYDRNGVLLYQLYQSENRTPIKLDQLPIHVVQAHIAIEDSNFFNHPGISIPDMGRALFHNLKFIKCHLNSSICPTTIQGASTITQQLIKNTLLTPERTIKRKVQEIYLALLIEKKYTKNQILERYLNTIAYGGTAYGIEAASQHFFDKHSYELTLAESALLAGLPVAPSAFSPFGSQPQSATTRQKLVLERMLYLNYISPNQYDEANNSQLTYAPPQTDIRAPHFVMFTRKELEKSIPTNILYQGGLNIKTSLDNNLQEFAQQILNQEIDKLKPLNVTNGAVLITKPNTGEILAMVGSINYFDTENQGNVNATIANRQPGSSIKPLTYAAALSNRYLEPDQKPITASSTILDIPTTYKIPGSPNYQPRNYDGKFHGAVSLRTALASSYNIPAVKLLNQIGVNKFIEFAQGLGISTWNEPSRYGLSITLGGAEVKMTDLAVAYGTFANLGIKQPLNPILSIQNYQPTELNLQSPFSPTPVINPAVAYIINDILSDPDARAPTFGRISKLTIPNHKVAVKTGTSNDLKDNWTIGYTPNYLVAVWVGNFDNSPMSRIASGITGATPIWHQIMNYLLTEYSPSSSEIVWQQPDNLISAQTCFTASEDCPNCKIKKELFIKGTEPDCNSIARKSQPELSLLNTTPTPTLKPIPISYKKRNPRQRVAPNN